MEQKNRDRSTNSTNNQQPSVNSKINLLLQAIADCASVLLCDQNFARSVNRALEILGKSAGADRLAIAEQHNDSSGQTLGYIVFRYEWLSSHTISQLHHPESSHINCEEFAEYHYQLIFGQHWGGLIEAYPEPFRSGQEKLGVKATYAIPIMVEGKYWGLIGLDFCQIARELSEAEIAVFKTAATCIGSAIQRERNQRAKEEAERNILLEREKAAQEKAIQLQKHNRVLKQRDRILAATAEASNVLLNGEDFEKAVNTALQIIGESIDTDRVGVMEYCDDPSGQSLGSVQALYEWDSVNAISQLNHPEVSRISFEGIEEWYYRGCQGEWCGGLIDELPEPFRSSMAKIGVKATYSIPIIVESKYWGIIGIDDCQEETHRSEAELSILKTAATCIGSAIQRERNRRAKEEAERNILLEREQAAQERATQLKEYNRVLKKRDRILAATAEASNVLLTGEDFDKAVNKALQIIGESLDTDRVTVIENWSNPSKPLVPHWKILYEWNSPNTIAQISHPEVTQGSYEGIEEWYELQSKGQSISCRLEEMSEPFRSGQAKIGVKILHAVPIFIEGKHWGLAGFDDCREETHRSEAELSILKTAAACIGGAIERERTRRAKEEAEKNILKEREKAATERAKLLQAVATVSNSLLRSPDYRTVLPEVLQILGEAAKSDRCSLVENVIDPKTGKAAVKICAEWCREGIPASIDSTPELETALLWEYFPQFQDKLAQGELSTFLVDDLLEPARSILQQQGNVSMTLVPIVIQGEFWGVFGFDYCQASQSFDRENTAIFAIAVDSIAAASAREQKDEALRASEKRYRELFEASNDGIHFVEFDPPIPVNLTVEEQIDRIYSSTRFTDVNPALERYCGLSQSEILGKHLTVIHSPDSEGHRSLMRRLIENGWQITNAESEDIDANGKKRYWLSHLFTTVENDCVVRGWGVVNNITPLKEAQLALLEAEQARSRELECLNAKLQQALKELSESEKRYRTLFELSNEGIYRFEIEQPISISLPIEEQVNIALQHYRFAEANEAYYAQIGVSNMDELVQFTLRDFHGNLEQNRQVNLAIMQNGYQIKNAETEETNALGKRKFFLNNIVCDVREGFVLGGWCMQTDITELKQAQLALLEAERQRVAQLEESNQILSLRDRWLEATANAANQLLATPDLEEGINAALKMLGESLEGDRLGVMQHSDDSTGESLGFWCQLYEWDSIGTVSQLVHPQLNKISTDGVEEYFAQLKAGEWWGGLIDEFPEPFRSGQIELGVKSTYAVPIFVDNQYWGILAIDYCREAKRLTLAEIAVFKTAASCVGSAIYRQQIQQRREQAEKTIILEREKAAQEKAAQLEESNQILSLRDRWLEATANAANQLLATPDLDEGINAALKMLGESLDCDRVAVMQHIGDSYHKTLGLMRQLYEWDSPGTISQLFHPQLNEISLDGIEKYFAQIQAGEWWGGLINEFPEPFRSGQIELGVKSTYAVPIFVGDRFWGILGIDHCREPKCLTPAEIAVFKTAASCVSSAISRQQIQQQREQAERTIILEREKAAQEKAAELTKVNQIISQSLGKLTDAADLDLFLGEVVLEINRQVGAITGSIFLYDANNHTLQQSLTVRNDIIYHGAAEHDCKLFHSPQPADLSPIFSYLCQTREISLLSTNYDADSTLWWQETLEWHRRMGHQEAAAIALMIGDKPLGLLGLAFTEKTALKPEELELIYALTNQASLAIQLTKLAQQAQKSALTDERNRMAREIHDTLAQAFTGISLQLEAARNSLSTQPEAAQERLLRAKMLAKEGINEARRSVRALRPEALESEDLITALHQLVDKMISGTNIKTEISIEGKPHSLNSEVEVNLFRIAQEAITNTLRHSQADQICIQLIYETDIFHLQIKDNGIGFNPKLLQNQGFGLIGMRERCDRLNGNLVINSASDRGTEIIVTV